MPMGALPKSNPAAHSKRAKPVIRMAPHRMIRKIREAGPYVPRERLAALAGRHPAADRRRGLPRDLIEDLRNPQAAGDTARQDDGFERVAQHDPNQHEPHERGGELHQTIVLTEAPCLFL
jgi:hypothetical protein